MHTRTLLSPFEHTTFAALSHLPLAVLDVSLPASGMGGPGSQARSANRQSQARP
jgi:hypothetical protein